MSSSLLFTPVSIGPMTVPNRFVMPPMGNNFAHTDGSLSERSLAYYAARAKGGFGLVTIEATVVDPTAKGGPRKPCLVSDATIGSFQRVVQACHAEGAKVSVQLQHAGPEGNPAITGYPLKAASAVPAAVGKAIPQAMTEDEIAVLAEQYGDAARRAEEAGADAVELHCAHGYLLHSFLSPRTNHRTDAYAGNTLEGRIRLHLQVIQAVREAVGKGFLLSMRFGGCDYTEGGSTIQDAAAAAKEFEKAGLDLLDMSGGLCFFFRPGHTESGYFSDLSQAVRESVSIPVVLTGGIQSRQDAETLLEAGKADLIGVGRAITKDPAWAKHAMEEAV